MPDTEKIEDNDANRQLRRALHAVKDMRAKLAAAETRSREPIAIVGLACRFPGSPNLAAFWRLLAEGRDAITEVPKERWDVDALFDPDPDAPGKMSTRWGGFIDGVDRFDAGFFGISPREALSIDPQQRLLLEVAWHALEHAGIPPDGLGGSRTAVYVGMSTNDYAQLLSSGGDLDWIDSHASLGNSVAVAAGRLAYTLGLQGPAMVVDTACSSALTAVHLALQALRSGEVPLALAAGVNLTLTPELTIGFSKARMMAADGRCKTFDARADGYVRGEGCGLVVLKRLSDALADGDTVHAVIRGSAVNQDGRSNGLTAPNGPAQEDVVRRALGNAGVQPDEIGYIEAHGTGTALGDPIEVRALGQVFGDRAGGAPPALGSVKTNVGHLEAAAGMAGLIKLVLALRAGSIPPHLHFERLNPMIEADGFPFRVPTRSLPWEPIAGRRIGGVSAFGFSGTNAHLVVEAPPSPPPRADSTRALQVLALSARDEAALLDLRGQVERELGTAGADLPDLAASLTAGRAQHPYRVACVAEDAKSAGAALVAATPMKAPRDPALAFLFTGQGCQFPGMGSGLMAETAFRETLERCEAALEGVIDRPLSRLLADSDAPLHRTELLQPALFSLEMALAELWRSWGLEPAMVAGHSLGEIAAACFAGAMDLEAGLAFVVERGRLMAKLSDRGGMIAAFAPADRVAEAIKDTGAVIAALNSPINTVVAGATEALAAAVRRLEADGIDQRALDVPTAFHSPVLDPCLDGLERAAAVMAARETRLPVASNLMGEALFRFDAAYWRRQARQPVRFADALRTLETQGCRLFLEIGPQPVLSTLGRDTLVSRAVFVPSLRRGTEDARALAEALIRLYENGAEVDWRAYQGRGWRRIDACAYPFRRERIWPPAPVLRPAPDAGPSGGHPLLGQRLATPLPQTLYDNLLSTIRLPFLADHRVFGEVVVPGAMHGVTALAVAGERGIVQPQVEDLVFEQALKVPPEGVRLQVVVEPPAAGGSDFALHGRMPDGSWVRHAVGRLGTNTEAAPAPVDLDALRGRLAPDADGPQPLFRMLGERGIELGPAFQGLRALWRGEGEALGQIELPSGLGPEAADLPIHPAVLDACFQMFGATFTGAGTDGGFLPLSIDRLLFWRRPLERFWCHVSTEDTGNSSEVVVGHFRLLDDTGFALLSVEGLQIKRVNPPAPRDILTNAFLTVDWVPAALPEVAWADPAPLAAAAGAAGTRLLADLRADEGLGEVLERLAVGYAADALRALGVAPGDATVKAAGAERLGVASHQRKLFRRVCEIAALDKSAAEQGGEALAGAAGSRYPDNALEIDLVARCGRGLVGVLQGRTDPLQLLFPTESAGEGNIYGDSALARVANGMTAAAVAEALENRGDNGPLRVLEVGAGTGATTAALLPLLMERPGSRYHFSDVSPGFLAPARQAFAAFDFVDYSVFDLEQAPEDQALVRASFDLIVAANVVHATADVRSSLGHLRTLLAPGGLLLLVESTLAQTWWDLVFGLTEGWWRFTDTGLRPRHPLLPSPVWERELRELGFTATASVAVDPAGCQSLILAAADHGPAEYLLVHDGRDGPARDLANALARRLGRVAVACRILDPRGAANALAGKAPAGVVYTGAVSGEDEVPLRQAFDLMRTMAEHGREGLWLVTRGACLVDESMASPRGALVRGLGKVAALEHPDLGCLRVDLDPQSGDPAGALARELISGDGEAEIAWRSDRRLASRLTRIAAPGGEAPRFDADGTYLIAGGYGGLGPLVAEWLARQGAGTLVLTGRREPAPELVERLAELPAKVLLRATDVADKSAMRVLFAEIDRELPPLKGIFHLAGNLADGALIGQDWERFASVLPAKVEGTRILDAMTRDRPLDHFVLFSSSASLIGNLGQANHAAANAYLDATAELRRSKGLAGLSINWGAWGEIGAVAEGAHVERMQTAGVHPIPPERGLEALGLAMGGDQARIGVVSVDWPFFLAGYEGRIPPFFEHLAAGSSGSRPAGKTTAANRPATTDLKRLLGGVEPDLRLERLTSFIREQAATVLGITDSGSIDPEQPLSELGLDSLLALELRTRLGDAVGRKQPATLLFNHPSVGALAAHFGPDVMDLASPSAPGEDALAAEIADLSEADLESLIDGELSRLLED